MNDRLLIRNGTRRPGETPVYVQKTTFINGGVFVIPFIYVDYITVLLNSVAHGSEVRELISIKTKELSKSSIHQYKRTEVSHGVS